jgi:hypothetical protein
VSANGPARDFMDLTHIQDAATTTTLGDAFITGALDQDEFEHKMGFDVASSLSVDNGPAPTDAPDDAESGDS